MADVITPFAGSDGATTDKFNSKIAQANAGFTAITLAALGGINRNLLHNWYFPNAVNQRGLTSGTAVSTAGYTLDRWKLASGSVTWTSGTGISLSGELLQYIETGVETGKTYTLSANIGGTIYSAALTASASGASAAVASGVTLGLKYSGSSYYFDIATTATVVSVKLEKGSISTLVNDAPPDFGEELLKCQRYFINRKTAVINSTAFSSSYISGFQFPAPMRISPTLTIYDWTGQTIGIVNLAGIATTLSVTSTNATNLGVGQIGVQSATTGSVYVFGYTASADL